MAKIGIFAGAFDPIHLGHKRFVKDSIARYSLNQILVLIDRGSKHKNLIASYEHRKKMVEISLQSIAKVQIVEHNYKYDSISNFLPEAKKNFLHEQIFLLLGKDVYEHINSWDGAKNLLQNVQLVVAERDNALKYGKVSSLKIRNSLSTGHELHGLDKRVEKYITKTKLYL